MINFAEYRTKTNFWGSKKIVVVFVLILLLLGSMTLYFYHRYRKAIENPQAILQSETDKITAKIGKFMELPDERPTLATVTDKDKLKDQVFFSKAQNGDKVLIFTTSNKAILYRPSNNKVIEVISLYDSGAKTAQPDNAASGNNGGVSQ